MGYAIKPGNQNTILIECVLIELYIKGNRRNKAKREKKKNGQKKLRNDLYSQEEKYNQMININFHTAYL